MDEEGSGGDSFKGASKDAAKKGQVVDVVIRDDDLPSDEVTGQYVVGSNSHLLTPDDVAGSGQGFASVTPQAAYARSMNQAKVDQMKNANKSAAETSPDVLGEGAADGFSGSAPSGTSSSDSQFVPVRNLETLYNVSGKEAVTKNAAPAVTSDGDQKFSAADEDLDTLPTMDDVDFSSSSGSGFGGDGVNTDSEFATTGVSHRGAEEPEVKDAPLMAKAISTLLANES